MGNLARHFLMPTLVATIVGTLWAVAWQHEMTDESRHAGQLVRFPTSDDRFRASESAVVDPR